MSSPGLVMRSARRLLPLLAAALFLAMFAGPTAVQAAETTTSTTAAASTTATSSTATTAQAAPTGVIPPIASQTPLNPGWKSDQIELRVMPEYDQKGVLVIMGFSLPADVPLPASFKFPLPAGAKIAGIGEVGPTGDFTYNYTTTYPTVEPGTDWDIATMDVKTYRKLQIDYYYDPGLPQGAGPRSFQVLAQMPMDAGTLLLHVQKPARATDFQVQPTLQGTGEAGDGFTYSVGSYSDVKAGSTLGHVVSYNNPDGGLSTDSTQATQDTPAKVNTNTVLLAAILIIVVFIGGIIVYSLYAKSRGPQPKKGRPTPRGGSAATASAGTKGKQTASNTSKSAAPKTVAATKAATKTNGATTKSAATGAAATPDEITPPDEAATSDATASAPTTDASTQPDDQAAEYCVACGEELDPNAPFCPNCGEAR